MNLSYKFVLLFLYITWVKSILATSEPVSSSYHKTTVTVENHMKDGSNFTIHCKSKDDDLGPHVVQVGSPYEWRFRVNLFTTTLFFCNTYWKGKFIGFNGFEGERDLDRCPHHCVWRFSEDGLAGYDERHPDPDLHYVWK